MSQLNGDQTRHVNAINTLGVYFRENESVYQKDEPLKKWINRLAENNSKISSLSTTKGNNGVGATTEKEDLKAVIAQSAGYICSYTADYADEMGNSQLFNIVNFSANYILHLRDAEIIGFVGGIVAAVTPLLGQPAFATYPVTAESLDQLSTQATTFNTGLGTNHNISITSSIASQAIDDIIKEARRIITRMDTLIINYKKDAPGFVTGYYDAKRIHNTGIRHSGISVKIENKAEVIIKDAKITLTHDQTIKRGQIVKTATISAEGTYDIIKCIAGHWTLTIVAPGYEAQTTAIKIVRGVIQTQSIIMQANAIELPQIQTA